MKNIKLPVLAVLLITSLIYSSCDDDEVPPFNDEESFTDVILMFSPEDGGTPVVVAASDPDGEGDADLQPEESVILSSNTTYILTIELVNTFNNNSMTDEIEEEADEHMFFFSWSDDIFANPDGNGNISNRSNPVIYNDEDENGLSLGLSTTWTTTNGPGSGSFQTLLKHQPGLKSETSTATDGATDMDITWELQIE